MQIDIVDSSGFLQSAKTLESWEEFQRNLQQIPYRIESSSRESTTYFVFLAKYIFVNFCNLIHSFCQDSVISTDKFIHSLFIELLFVDSADIRDINYEYLKKDYSTDVLSFPLQILPWNPYEFITADYDFVLCPVAIDGTAHSIPMQCLGSIIINTDEVLLQAKALKHNLYAELSILFIHAFLHLLGFDHERDRGEQRNFEKAIRESLNLPYGLIERNIMGETS